MVTNVGMVPGQAVNWCRVFLRPKEREGGVEEREREIAPVKHAHRTISQPYTQPSTCNQLSHHRVKKFFVSVNFSPLPLRVHLRLEIQVPCSLFPSMKPSNTSRVITLLSLQKSTKITIVTTYDLI